MNVTSCFLLAAWTISLIAGHFFLLAMSVVLCWRKARKQTDPKRHLEGSSEDWGLRALATSGLPWEQDTVMPGRAEEGMLEARGPSGRGKGTAHTPVIAL